jgi:endonuclease G
MKKIRLFAFCAAAAVFTACEVSEQFEPAFPGAVPPGETIELSDASEVFVFTSDPNDSDVMTRTEHDGSKIIWSTGDKIRMGLTVNDVWQGSGGNASSYSQAKLFASQGLASGGQTAAFTVPTSFSSTNPGTYKFYTIYPAAACGENGFSANDVLTVNIPAEQTPSASSFDPAADLMVGSSVKTYTSKPADSIPLMWERLVAHGEITLKNLQGLTTGETVKSVTLTAQSGAQLTGSYSVNLKTATVTGAVNASNSVTVSGDNLSFDGSNLTVWIGILPVTLTSLKVELETSAATYTREISSCQKIFAGNTHNKLGINMANVARKKNGYVKVTQSQTDWSGQYVLGFDNGTVRKMLTGISNTSTKYGLATDVTITDNTIAYEDGHPYEITIAKSGSYYTMSFGGKYLSWNSGNSLILADSPTDYSNGGKWTISYSGTLTISNANTSQRLLQYNTGSPRFACYTSAQEAPSLYKLTGSSGGDTPPDPQPEATATVTTAAAGDIVQTSATLNGSFSGATGTISEVGFYWGTTNNPATKVVANGTTSPFSYSLSGLTAGTKYYFKAYVKEYNAATASVEERTGSVQSFTTEAEQQSGGDYELVTASQSDWSGAYVLGYLDSSTSAILLIGTSNTSTNYGTVNNNNPTSVNNGVIAASAGSPYEITIAKSGNYYTLYLTGVGYLGWTGGNTLAFASSAGSNSYKWSISYSGGSLTITNAGDSTRKLQYNSGSPRFACYTTTQKAPQLFKRAGSSTPQITVTTEAVSNLANTSVTLNGSYVVPTGLSVTERGFYFGTGSDPSTKIIVSGTGTSFSYSRTGLTKGTAYSYKAYAIESDGTTTTTRYGEVVYFTTTGGTNVPTGWLELPATTGTDSENYVGTFYGSGGTTARYRNYSYSYNYTYYASMWVAWPLTSSHTSGSASTSSWRYNPSISNNKQVNIISNAYGTMYNAGTYSRGHQCPNADRKSDDTMNLQTYYSTNQTPQIQNSFNGGIWSSLEGATRNLLSGDYASDMVYVATGPVYRKVGGNETITYLTGASGANPSSLPVPNYYWKAILKVKWSGTSVTEASAIGFWFEHKTYSDSYTNHTVSVNQIEQWTGLDLFTNLPDGIEATAESNTSWDTFKKFVGQSESAFQ